jgi:para-aminobenzoate synthetase component 1
VVNKKIKVPEGENGLIFMRKFLQKNFRKKKPNDPPFTRGFVGFVSYDLSAKWVIGKQRCHPRAMPTGRQESGDLINKAQKSEGCPEVHFVYVDKVFAFKNKRRGYFGKACGGPAHSMHKIAAPLSNITKSQYFQKLHKIKNYLFSGDTYQVNFSQKFITPYVGDAFDLYKKVTRINPSPFQFFMETPKFAVISNSPERLMKIGRDSVIETRPIKGTVPRGKNEKEDARNVEKLMASPKEAAELAMIVDLERNDLGKICVPGTVEVNKNRVVEKYSHVIHTVSNVRGILEKKYDWLDALHALFPGGSVTGCPKKRTMEIINELEGEPRGVYCGSAGYIDLSGQCDFNIMIRTLWLDKSKKSHKLVFRSGGGIVVDSNPKREYEETAHKAKALVFAINSKVVE